MPAIFISYRRDDCPGHAGRLYDALSARFGEDQVFLDVDAEPGLDYVEQIQEAVGSCDALVVVIGPRWLTAKGPGRRRRLDDPHDIVRLEVAAALERDIRVFPVLVGGARMPRPDDLPEELVRLARRNAVEISDVHWRQGVGHLIRALERSTGVAAPEPAGASGPPQSRPPWSELKRRLADRRVGAAVAVAAVVAVAVSGIGLLAFGGGAEAGKPTRITFAYSPEKEELLRPLIRRFNRARKEADGHPVVVRGKSISSGEAQARIARGAFKPVAWSPASSLWGRLLNFEAGDDLVPEENPSLVRTPLVIAMWEPLARALGWPRQDVGFQEVLRLAESPRGWALYDRPYGRFKLGHTNPDFSTSGLSAVAAQYYATVGKREGLDEDDVARPDVRRRIRAIERSIVHYGDTTLFFAEQLERYGREYASAVAMEEVTLVDFNRKRSGTRLVALYPKEGTFFSDNPFIVLDAPWVDGDQEEAAEVFGEWLADELTPERAAEGGFRPGDPDEKALPPVDERNGADPSQPERVLELPEPSVLDRIKSAWRQDRKPANIMLVVDTSGSMRKGRRLAEAKKGLRAFIRQLAERDRVGLMSFGSQVFRHIPLAPIGQRRAQLERAVDVLVAQGGTALYDASARALAAVRRLRDSNRINAVVVLSDGVDTHSSTSRQALIQALQRQTLGSGENVRLYTIAYGSGASRRLLEDIAVASGGAGFEGRPSQIEAVYRSISSFF